jgi:transcriptional regulator with XRE-family HTH domain
MNAVAKTINDLQNQAALSGIDVANVAHVSKATVSRWSNGKSAPQPATQLVLSDLNYVVGRLREFYEPDEIRVWLYARNHLLGGERAMDLIHENRTEEVLEAIERIGALVYL